MRVTVVYIFSVFCLGWFLVFGAPPMSTTFTVTDSAQCVANGGITITVYGGTPPFFFKLDTTGAAGSDPYFRGLPPGNNYHYTVTDNQGRDDGQYFTIGTLPLPSAVMSHTDVTCSNPSGSITFNSPSGGNPSYTYSINGVDFYASNVFSGLSANIYTATIKDSDGCTSGYSVNILSPTHPTVSVSKTDVTCNGRADGTITFSNPTGGSPPYQYSVDGMAGTYTPAMTITSLPPKAYSPSIIDGAGCITAASVTISEPPALNLVITHTDDPNCGTPSGSFVASASGGTSASTKYTYTASGQTITDTIAHFTVVTGLNQVSVSDDKGCSKPGSFSINPGTVKVTASVDYTNITCHGSGSVGSISINATHGNPPYTYGVNGNFGTASAFNNLPEGPYNLVIKDSFLCTFSLPVTISRPPELSFNASLISNVSCQAGQQSMGSVALSTQGGYSSNGTYFYHDNGTVINAPAVYNWTTLPAGLQTLYVTDSNGCRSPDANITVYPAKETCCPTGFAKAPNGTCIDIDECSINHGGCDEIVSCTNTNGGRTCGACPPGYTGSGDTICKSTCGDGRCTGLENCVNCFKDCSAISCGLCGDGFCDESNQETCSSCFEDCGPCDKTCPQNCNGHGACVNGLCVCTGTWTDPACGTEAGSPFNVTVPPGRPSLNLSSSQEQFSISIKSIGELDPSGNVIRSFYVANMSFSYSTATNGNNILHNYTTTIETDVTMSVILQQFENPSTTISFAGTNLTFPPHTLKLTIQVQKWRFFSLANSLVIVLDSLGADDTTDCVGTTDGASVAYILVVAGNTTLYGQFMDKAELDDRVRSVKYSAGKEGVTITVPHFWDYADLDPNFNVLLGDPTQYTNLCEKSSPQKKGGLGVGKKVIAIVIPVVFFCAVVAVAFIVLFPRIKTWRKVHKAEKVRSVDMDDKSHAENRRV